MKAYYFLSQQEDAYKRNKQAFSRLGFEIEEFGGNAYKVNGLPAGLPNVNLKQMLIDIIDGSGRRVGGIFV